MQGWTLTSEYCVSVSPFVKFVNHNLFGKILIAILYPFFAQSSELGVLSICSLFVLLVRISQAILSCFMDFLTCATLQCKTIFRYMLAEGLGLSGIVSILFTGIVSGYQLFRLSDNLFLVEEVKEIWF